MSLKNLSVKSKSHKLLVNYLKNKKINRIYEIFEKSLKLDKDFAVAVSGGPDSLALAFLAKIFSIKSRLIAKFFIIDHKLRPESSEEAKIVKKVLKKYSINAEILTWKGKKPKKNIQSIARQERYKLLYSRCNKFKIENILLGHHQNDLIENFFIRLLRGSGLKGLVSFDKKNEINNITLHRPLLNQKKDNLKFISKNVFNFYIKDPTNLDEKYQRIKIRKFINNLQKNGLDENKFIKTINNLKSSNKVVNFYVSKNLKKNSFFSDKQNQIILNKDFFYQPYEVIFRSLLESLKLIGKKYYPVRGKKLDRIIKAIVNNQLNKTTLGGCVIEKFNQTVIIYKEY